MDRHYKLVAKIWCSFGQRAFNNYVDQILPNFDPPTSSSGLKWIFYICILSTICHKTHMDIQLVFPQEEMSGDKKKSCPSVPLSQGQCFRTSFSCFRTSFPCFRTSFSWFRTSILVLEHSFLLCPVLSRVPSRILAVPARPVPSLGKIFSSSRCPFVPGQGGNFCPVVPKNCTVPSRWEP